MKKTTRNMTVALVSKLLVILSGIVAQRFILVSYGSEINGLTSSINQFMSYFTLLEAGLGTASIQALYHPITQNENRGISGILNATQKQYRQIGFVFAGLWAGMSFLMPLISNSDMHFSFVASVTFLSGIGTILNYFFIGKYTVLLNADKKIYVLHILDAAIAILNCTLKVLIVNAGFNIIVVQLTVIFTTLFRLLVLYLYFLKNYKYLDKTVPPDMNATRKRWNVLIHNIVGMVTNHTDIILLTVLSSFSNVSVYSVYNYIYNNINAVISTTFLTAPLATLGQLAERKDSRLGSIFNLYELGFMTILHIILVTAFAMTLPFIKLYTADVSDINYIDYGIAILFACVQYLYLIRTPALVMINAGGYFKETQVGAIIEAVINLCVSIPMFFVLGTKGILIGTVAALLFRSTDVTIFCYRHILNIKFPSLIFKLIDHMAVSVVIILLYNLIFSPFVSSWGHWFLRALIVFCGASLIFLINNVIFYRKEFSYTKTIIMNFLSNRKKHV